MTVLRLVLLHTTRLMSDRRRELFHRISSLPDVKLQEPFARWNERCKGAHLYMAHGGEDYHEEDLKSYCELQKVPYVLFSGSQSEPEPIGGYGYKIPAVLFEAGIEEFLREWVLSGSFPGWELLIGDPVKDAALEVLHAGLGGDGQRVGEALDRLRSLTRGRFPAGARDEIEGVCRELVQPTKQDSRDSLTRIRDLLFGVGDDQGLVPALVRARQRIG
jgi:hypothetical protein